MIGQRYVAYASVCDVAVTLIYFTQRDSYIHSHARVLYHTTQAPSPAAAPFILALEVLDNLPHDKASVWHLSGHVCMNM